MPHARKKPTPGGKRTYPIPQWRFREMLLGLGTSNELRAKLLAKGYPAPPAASIQGWRHRNVIPAGWVPVIVQMQIDEGLVSSIEGMRLTE